MLKLTLSNDTSCLKNEPKEYDSLSSSSSSLIPNKVIELFSSYKALGQNIDIKKHYCYKKFWKNPKAIIISISLLISILYITKEHPTRSLNKKIKEKINKVKLEREKTNRKLLEYKKKNSEYKIIENVADNELANELKKIIPLKRHNRQISIKDKEIIHISMSLSRNYVFPILVSMTSIMENCNKNQTFIKFHIMFAGNIDPEDINIIDSIYKHYPYNVQILFYNMTDAFEYKKILKKVGYSGYYRLLLAELLSDIDRTIYLDGDTLTFTDLAEMYQISFGDNYVLGFLDMCIERFRVFGLDLSEYYICSGVMLMNLKKIREDNKTKELIYFVFNYYNRTYKADQSIINYVFSPYVGTLPVKYGIFNLIGMDDLKVYIDKDKVNLNKVEAYEALKAPGIMHYVLCRPKIWKENSTRWYGAYIDQSCQDDTKIWYYFANKTDYYAQIFNQYMK